MQRALLLAILGTILLTPVVVVSAQQNAICVLAFEDTNENGVRDGGEIALPGINVNLAINTDIIIATYITTQENSQHCFENLTPGIYNIYFADSPNHRATTQSSAAMEIRNGQRIRIEFGALPEEPIKFDTVAPANSDSSPASEQLDSYTRILLALLGAVIVMIFMIGFGAVVMSIMY